MLNENKGSNRVPRGCGWRVEARFARVANRYCFTPSYRGDSLGVRLMRILGILEQLADVKDVK